MIARTVDRLTAMHPVAEKYCRERIYSFFETTNGRNIAVFMISGIAAGLFAGSPNSVLRVLSLAVTVIVWAEAAVLAGFLRHWVFVVFSAAYFMLPYVFVIVPGTAEAAQATEFQYMLSDMMLAVPLRPMSTIAGEGDPQFISACMLAAYLILFFAGVRVRSLAKRSDFYCRTRLDQLK